MKNTFWEAVTTPFNIERKNQIEVVAKRLCLGGVTIHNPIAHARLKEELAERIWVYEYRNEWSAKKTLQEWALRLLALENTVCQPKAKERAIASSVETELHERIQGLAQLTTDAWADLTSTRQQLAQARAELAAAQQPKSLLWHLGEWLSARFIVPKLQFCQP